MGTAALETNTIVERRPSPTATTIWRWLRFPTGRDHVAGRGQRPVEDHLPLAQGCPWRNTTNSTVGFCAQVGEYQHALEWNGANPLEIFVGNDSGLWRSMDAIGETGSVCAAERRHPLSEPEREPGIAGRGGEHLATGQTPYTMMAGLGVNGTAGATAAPDRRRSGRRSLAARAGRWRLTPKPLRIGM
jgi:hypothetical protein